MPNNQEAVDTSAIQIDIAALEVPDYRLDIEMPAELVADIFDRLKEGGYDYGEEQMTSLLTKICIDEGMVRFDKNSIWGPKLMPGTEPGKYCENKSFVFSMIVDATPTQAFKKIDSIPIQQRNLKISDDLVDTEMYEQQLLFGLHSDYSGELAYGDEITCSATLTVDGKSEPEFAVETCTIRVPKEGQPIVIGAFKCDEGKQLRGKNAPSTISISLTQQQGTIAVLVLDVNSAKRITPCAIEEVLKQYGTPNETILKAQIKHSLQRNFDRENNTIMRNQLYNYLLDTVDVPVSSRIIDDHLKDLCKSEQERNPDQMQLSDEVKNKLRAKAESIAKRRVITSCYQEMFNLNINEEDIEEQIADIAESKRMRPEEVREEFVSGDRMHVLGNMVMEKKVFSRLKDKMNFTNAS